MLTSVPRERPPLASGDTVTCGHHPPSPRHRSLIRWVALLAPLPRPQHVLQPHEQPLEDVAETGTLGLLSTRQAPSSLSHQDTWSIEEAGEGGASL